LQSLDARGLSDADIDVVVLSHLHFDHAGGLLKPYRAGAPLELCFPRAEFVVTRGAWERALRPHARDRASFIPELPELLDRSGRLRVLDSLEDGARFLGERFSLRTSDGHTPSMLHTLVRGERAELFFCADLVPGSAWLHLPITMGYDRYPERLIDEKGELFSELLERGTYLFFTHDASLAAARLTRDDKGRFGAGARARDFVQWDLDTNLQPDTPDSL
jgi:glyoxylase-like metal-dependent hydrolase (beta-lactamase superfamily II)